MRAAAVAIAAVLAITAAGCSAADGDSVALEGPSTSAASTPASPPVKTPVPTAAPKASSTGAPKTQASSKPAAPKSAKPKPAAPSKLKPTAGQYISYSDYAANTNKYASGDVVLFFHAPRCPKCRATEDSINSDGVPAGLTIVKVDFDSSNQLRQRYGVTVQHTYVQVNDSGDSLKKWTGTYGDTSVAGIAAKTV